MVSRKNRTVSQLNELVSRQSELPDIICFDYFDTVVFRTVEPEHTKHLACKQLSLLFNGQIKGEEIYDIRRRLEAELCQKNAAYGKDLDFNFCDFCRHFYDTLREHAVEGLSRFTKTEFLEILTDIEVVIENHVQKPHDHMVAILKQLQSLDVTVVLISDFYLPQSIFQKILTFHGLKKYFDALFISADKGVTKGSGKLFDVMMDELYCSPSSILMIGDNPHADIQMAANKGIRTVWVDHPKQKQFYQWWKKSNENSSLRDHKLEKQLMKAIRDYGGLLFPEIGASLWFFTYQLFQQLLHDHVTSISFFPRRGDFSNVCSSNFKRNSMGVRSLKHITCWFRESLPTFVH